MVAHKKDTHMVFQVVFVGMDDDIEQDRQTGMRKRRGKDQVMATNQESHEIFIVLDNIQDILACLEGQRGWINTKTYSGAVTSKWSHPGSTPEDSPVQSAFL